MPRAKKSDKFHIVGVKKKGKDKGKGFLCLNFGYEGGVENITLLDLNDYLKEHTINPKDVPLHNLSTDFALNIMVNVH